MHSVIHHLTRLWFTPWYYTIPFAFLLWVILVFYTGIVHVLILYVPSRSLFFLRYIIHLSLVIPHPVQLVAKFFPHRSHLY